MKRISLLMLGVIMVLTVVGAWAAGSEKDLRSAIKDKSVSKVKKAAEQIVQDNNDKAFQTLIQTVKGLTAEEMEFYWTVLNAMPSFSNNDVIIKMGEYIVKNKNSPLARDLLYALKGNKSKDIIPLLGMVIQDGTGEMKLMAIDQSAEVYYKDTVRMLIEVMKGLDDKKDGDLVRKLAEALSSVIGQEMGSYVQTWVSWWEANKDKPEEEIVKPMQGSNSETGTAADHFSYVRNTAFNRLKKMSADKIIVVSAIAGSCPCGGDHNFDKIEDILTKFAIPHTVVSKKDFEQVSYKLDDKWFVGMNCNQFQEHCTGSTCFATQGAGGWRLQTCGGKGPHNPQSTKLSDKSVKKLDEFVANGGYLFTEDAIMTEVLERGFKGVVRHTEDLPEKVVKIFPASGASTHPYLRGVFDKPESAGGGMMPGEGGEGGGTEDVSGGTMSVKVKMRSNVGKATWKIDNLSPDIKIAKPEAVTVLIVTPSLKSDNKDGAPVAITFSYSEAGPTQVTTGGGGGGSGYISGISLGQLKGGRVLHVMSHFGKQKSADDEFPLQNLIVNFMTELNERKLGLARKR